MHDGRVYLAFEHLTGRSLRAEMAGRPMNARRAVEAAIAIADAVAEAHALGFLHSGISPDSIALTCQGTREGRGVLTSERTLGVRGPE